MITLDNVTKLIVSPRGSRKLLANVSIDIPTNRRIALLGPSRDDNLQFMNLLCHAALPTSGRVIPNVRVSFPAGDLRGVNPELSVRFNVEHLARIYGVDVKSTISFVQKVVNLGPAFDKSFSEVPKEVKSELGYILTYCLPFDLYLLAREPPEFGYPNSTRPSKVLLDLRLAQSAGFIVAPRTPQFARDHCDMALVLRGGQVTAFLNMEAAIQASLAPSRKKA